MNQSEYLEHVGRQLAEAVDSLHRLTIAVAAISERLDNLEALNLPEWVAAVDDKTALSVRTSGE